MESYGNWWNKNHFLRGESTTLRLKTVECDFALCVCFIWRSFFVLHRTQPRSSVFFCKKPNSWLPVNSSQLGCLVVASQNFLGKCTGTDNPVESKFEELRLPWVSWEKKSLSPTGAPLRRKSGRVRVGDVQKFFRRNQVFHNKRVHSFFFFFSNVYSI